MSELLIDAEQGAGYSDDTYKGTLDSTTGIYFPLKGLGPDWYTEWVKQTAQVIRNVLGHSFRIYKDSTDGLLQFSISPGALWFSGSLVSVSGALNKTITSSVTNLISISTTGVITIGTSWPAAAHFRVAQIVAGSTSWDLQADLTDLRHQVLYRTLNSGRIQSEDLEDVAKWTVWVVPDAEDTSPQTITIQANDLSGAALTTVQYVNVSIHNTSDGGPVTDTNATIAVGAKGTLISSLLPSRELYCKTNASGELEITITKITLGIAYVLVRPYRRSSIGDYRDIGTINIDA